MSVAKNNRARDAIARASRMVLGAVCAGFAILVAGQAKAASVTFDFFNYPSNGEPFAYGTFTLTSSLLTPPNPASPDTFDLTPSELAAAGETVLGDLTSFTFSFDGHTLTQADVAGAASGWAADFNQLTSVFSAAHTFADGTLVLGAVNDNWFVQFGSQAVAGEWLITPVPLPGAAWLLLSGIGLAGVFRRRGQGSRAPL